MRVLLLVVGLLVGCHQTPEEETQDVCDAYCDCLYPGALPSTFDQCVNQQCIPQLPPVSDPCLQCVYAHDQVCSDLEQDCSQLCFGLVSGRFGGMQ
jgi:hypothetical protein